MHYTALWSKRFLHLSLFGSTMVHCCFPYHEPTMWLVKPEKILLKINLYQGYWSIFLTYLPRNHGANLNPTTYRELPVSQFSQGKPCSHCRDPVFKAGISLKTLYMPVWDCSAFNLYLSLFSGFMNHVIKNILVNQLVIKRILMWKLILLCHVIYIEICSNISMPFQCSQVINLRCINRQKSFSYLMLWSAQLVKNFDSRI